MKKSPYDIRQELLALPAHETVSDEDFQTCLSVMRSMMGVSREDERRVMLDEMCSMVYRASRRERRDAKKQRQRSADSEQIGLTGIRAVGDLEERREAVIPARADQWDVTLEKPRACYVCKAPYTRLHHFYDRICPKCAPKHWERRFQRCDMSGRRVLLTGGRIKIGFELGLKLLRDGAEVLVTTRFPRDAARRYAEAEDFDEWSHRLHLYGLELKHIPSVEAFCDHVVQEFGSLDVIISNAAQTVRRPDAYYAEVLEFERGLELDARAEARVRELGVASDYALALRRYERAHELMFPARIERDDELFPPREYDEDGLQLDLRQTNSWMQRLGEIGTVEMLEVQLVNNIAPFVLNSRLEPALMASSFPDRYIVNVTAKEGQFVVNHKSWRHPHTNMAKAAMNMMTRTSAQDFARRGIYMTSVDTGWVTYEQPQHIKGEWLSENNGPPLDVVDGAARVYDPIVRGVRDRRYDSGKLFVNYDEAPW